MSSTASEIVAVFMTGVSSSSMVGDLQAADELRESTSVSLAGHSRSAAPQADRTAFAERLSGPKVAGRTDRCREH